MPQCHSMVVSDLEANCLRHHASPLGPWDLTDGWCSLFVPRHVAGLAPKKSQRTAAFWFFQYHNNRMVLDVCVVLGHVGPSTSSAGPAHRAQGPTNPSGWVRLWIMDSWSIWGFTGALEFEAVWRETWTIFNLCSTSWSFWLQTPLACARTSSADPNWRLLRDDG